MGMTIIEKIFARKAGLDSVSPGDTVVVDVDMTVMTVLIDLQFATMWIQPNRIHDPDKLVPKGVQVHRVVHDDGQSRLVDRVFQANSVPMAVARYRERSSVARATSDHADAMTRANILRVDERPAQEVNRQSGS